MTEHPPENPNEKNPGAASIHGHWLSHIVSLTVLLTILWLLLSGIYTPLILAFGAASIALTMLVSIRMDLLDYEGLPFHIALKTTSRYWPWLIWEIILANIDVIKRILSPKLDISPVLFETETHQVSDLGVVIYANSITLTPGTVTVDISPGRIQVHALSQAGADGILDGEMDKRCGRLERE